jgi:hypothetical protein
VFMSLLSEVALRTPPWSLGACCCKLLSRSLNCQLQHCQLSCQAGKFCSLLPVITSAGQIPLDRPLSVTVMDWCGLAGFWPALPLCGLYFYPLIPFAMNLCHLCQKKRKELLLLRQPLAPRFTFCTESKKQNLCSTRSNLWWISQWS